MLVERCQLDERNVNRYILPTIEFDDDAMHGKEQIVIRLLESLCDCIKFAFVGAGVIRLGLARHGADKVRVDSHCKAYHIDCFLYVGFPVSTLFR